MSRPRLTTSQKPTALSLKAEGFSTKEVACQLSMNGSMVDVMFNAGRFTSGVADSWSPRAGHLSIGEREEIRVGLSQGESVSSIARRLGRSPSTVSREVRANGGRENYRIWRAHCRARESARRPQEFTLQHGPREHYVSRHLAELGSPREICERLALVRVPRVFVHPFRLIPYSDSEGVRTPRRWLARTLT